MSGLDSEGRALSPKEADRHVAEALSKLDAARAMYAEDEEPPAAASRSRRASSTSTRRRATESTEMFPYMNSFIFSAPAPAPAPAPARPAAGGGRSLYEATMDLKRGEGLTTRQQINQMTSVTARRKVSRLPRLREVHSAIGGKMKSLVSSGWLQKRTRVFVERARSAHGRFFRRSRFGPRLTQGPTHAGPPG